MSNMIEDIDCAGEAMKAASFDEALHICEAGRSRELLERSDIDIDVRLEAYECYLDIKCADMPTGYYYVGRALLEAKRDSTISNGKVTD